MDRFLSARYRNSCARCSHKTLQVSCWDENEGRVQVLCNNVVITHVDSCCGWCDPKALQVILRFDSIDQLQPLQWAQRTDSIHYRAVLILSHTVKVSLQDGERWFFMTFTVSPEHSCCPTKHLLSQEREKVSPGKYFPCDLTEATSIRLKPSESKPHLFWHNKLTFWTSWTNNMLDQVGTSFRLYLFLWLFQKHHWPIIDGDI